MSSTTQLRVQICAVSCVLGGATAFLAFTSRGLLVLFVAVVAAAGLALWLRFSQPHIFHPSSSARQPHPGAQASLKRVVTANAKGVTSRPVERPETHLTDQQARLG